MMQMDALNTRVKYLDGVAPCKVTNFHREPPGNMANLCSAYTLPQDKFIQTHSPQKLA